MDERLPRHPNVFLAIKKCDNKPVVLKFYPTKKAFDNALKMHRSARDLDGVCKYVRSVEGHKLAIVGCRTRFKRLVFLRVSFLNALR